MGSLFSYFQGEEEVQQPDPKELEKANLATKRALGSVLGAFVGDAAGAYLEFWRKGKITEAIVDEALTFPGGGSLRIGPGQITDDSEMAMCLLHALGTTQGLDLDEIQKQFGNWLYSSPFDVGITTQQALCVINSESPDPIISFENTIENTQRSLSNGCLMRVTPQAVWGHKLSKEDLYHAVKYQTLMTHSNKVAIDATYLYCYAISLLINQVHAGEEEGKAVFRDVIEEARRIRTEGQTEDIVEWLSVIEGSVYDARTTILPQCTGRGMGFLKLALVWSFFYLYHDISYTDAIRDMLLQGGDTDTNAAIAGGLIGARYTMHGTREVEWLSKVLLYDCNKDRKGHRRPEWLSTHKELCSLLIETYQRAPDSLVIKCQGKTMTAEEIEKMIRH